MSSLESTSLRPTANDKNMRLGRILAPTLAGICVVASAAFFVLAHYFDRNYQVANWLHYGALLSSGGAFGFCGLSIMIFGAIAQAKSQLSQPHNQ